MSLEFIDEEHIYLLDGIILPSVSDIVATILGNPYENIPSYILNNAAEYGTEIHNIIEEYESGKERSFYTIMQEVSLDSYKKIKKELGFEVIKQEEMIHYKDVYAGRYDMLIEVDKETVLVDIKTTAELYRDRLEMQLSLYNKVVKADKMACIWIPKDNPAMFLWVEEIETDEIIKRYLKEKENE